MGRMRVPGVKGWWSARADDQGKIASARSKEKMGIMRVMGIMEKRAFHNSHTSHDSHDSQNSHQLIYFFVTAMASFNSLTPALETAMELVRLSRASSGL